MGEGAGGLLDEFRSDFLRNEEEAATRGRSDALAKSLASDGSLGLDIVDEIMDSTGLPANSDLNASYCIRRSCSVSRTVSDALTMRLVYINDSALVCVRSLACGL